MQAGEGDSVLRDVAGAMAGAGAEEYSGRTWNPRDQVEIKENEISFTLSQLW